MESAGEFVREHRSERSQDPPYRVAFLLVPGFSMMALSSAVEPLRSVNRLANIRLYDWAVVAKKQGAVAAGNGLELTAAHSVDDAPEADLTIVVASLDVETYHERSVLRHLRRLRAAGRSVGAISNGALILARAGLAAGTRVTIHWEMRRFLADEFPDLEVCSDLYCTDRGVLTAAGGMAAMDLMLDLIGTKNGPGIAADVSEQFLHGPIRPATDAQRTDVRWRYQVNDKRLIAAIRMMEAEMEAPLKVSHIADRTKVSERQLERLFDSAFGKTPSEFYMDVRVKAARAMLLHSSLSLDEISEATGFSSAAHFSRTVAARCGAPPSAIRKRRF